MPIEVLPCLAGADSWRKAVSFWLSKQLVSDFQSSERGGSPSFLGRTPSQGSHQHQHAILKRPQSVPPSCCWTGTEEASILDCCFIDAYQLLLQAWSEFVSRSCPCNFTPSVVGGNPVFSLHDKEDLHSWKRIKTILSEYVNVFVLLTVFVLSSRIVFCLWEIYSTLIQTELTGGIPAVEESKDWSDVSGTGMKFYVWGQGVVMWLTLPLKIQSAKYAKYIKCKVQEWQVLGAWRSCV